MNKKNFTLEDVKKILEDFGFEWVDRLSYNPNNNKYEKIKTNVFNSKKQIFLSLKNTKNYVLSLALAEINNKTFKLTINGSKIDITEEWAKLLEEKTNEVLK